MIKFSSICFLTSFLILIHHYHKHNRFYDKADLKNLKLKSHEFWMIFFTILGFVLDSIGL